MAAESKSGCSHSHSEIHEAFTIKKLDWILQFWPPSSSPPFALSPSLLRPKGLLTWPKLLSSFCSGELPPDPWGRSRWLSSQLVNIVLRWKWCPLIVLSARSFRPVLQLQRAPRQRPRARQTDRQTDSYSRSDDRPTNRRACACAVQAVHELQKRSRERKRETAWWNKQEQCLSSVLNSSATEEMILRIDLHFCTLMLRF